MHPVSQSTWLTKEPYNRCAYKCASKNSLFRTLNDLTMCWNSVKLNVVIDAVKERLQKVKILDYIFFRPLQIRQKGGSVEWRGRSKLCFSFRRRQKNWHATLGRLHHADNQVVGRWEDVERVIKYFGVHFGLALCYYIGCISLLCVTKTKFFFKLFFQLISRNFSLFSCVP